MILWRVERGPAALLDVDPAVGIAVSPRAANGVEVVSNGNDCRGLAEYQTIVAGAAGLVAPIGEPGVIAAVEVRPAAGTTSSGRWSSQLGEAKARVVLALRSCRVTHAAHSP